MSSALSPLWQVLGGLSLTSPFPAAALPPQVLREMRVKGALMDHKEIRAAMGVRVVAPGLEQAVAGERQEVEGVRPGLSWAVDGVLVQGRVLKQGQVRDGDLSPARAPPGE